MHISNKKLIQIAISANVFEWYDFCISAYLAVVMGYVFFVTSSPIIAMIKSFAVFAIAYIARPVGSFMFGHIGDKYGSGIALKYSIITMAISTACIAILPGYSLIGNMAPILLILFRIIQGVAAGAELPISASFVFEHSPSDNVSALNSFINAGGVLGVLLASSIVSVTYAYFPEKSILSWAWRLPFIFSLPLLITIYFIRKDFKVISIQQSYEPKQKNYFRKFIQASLLVIFLEVSFYILLVWFPTYLQYIVKISSYNAKLSNVLALLVFAITGVLFGYLGKFVSHKYLMAGGIVLLISFIYPLFLMLPTANFTILVFIQIFFAVLLASVGGLYFFTILDLFPLNIRNRSMAICFSLPTAIFGGSAPLICSYFTHYYHMLFFPGLYIIGLGILALFSITTL